MGATSEKVVSWAEIGKSVLRENLKKMVTFVTSVTCSFLFLIINYLTAKNHVTFL